MRRAGTIGVAVSMSVLALACSLAPHPGSRADGGSAGAPPGGMGGTPSVGGDGGGGQPNDCGSFEPAGGLAGLTSFAGDGHEIVEAASMLPDGSMWLAMSYDAAFTLVGEPLAAPDGIDTVVARVDADTKLVAGDVHRIGGAGQQRLCAISLSVDGALVALGHVSGGAELVIDDVPVADIADGDAFLATFAAGETRVHRLRASALRACGLVTDSTGATWVAGSFQGTLGVHDASGEIIGATGSAPVLFNGFALRLGPGAPPYLTTFGPPVGEGTPDDQARVAGIISLPPEKTVVLGDFRGTLALGQGLYEAEGGSDVWVARLDGQAAYDDRGVFQGAGEVTATAIGRSPSGRAFFTGSYQGDLGFGDVEPAVSGVFLSRLKLNDLKLGGTEVVTVTSGTIEPTAVAPYPYGRGIVVVGSFAAPEFSLLGDTMINDDADPDGFVVAFADDMDLLYAWHLPASGGAYPRAAVTAPCRSIAISGSFVNGPAAPRRLGDSDAAGALVDAAGADGFLMQLVP
jgi:hypothetical protein